MSEDGQKPLYPSQLFSQYTTAFEGNMLGYILYGIYVVIAGASLPLLRKKRSKIFLSFTIFQLLITTVYIAMSLYGSPAQLLAIFGLFGVNGPDSLSPWNSLAVNAAFLVNTLASDGFILYRCYVVCKSNKFAVALPTLIYLATVGASIAWFVVDSMPGAVYSTRGVQVAGVATFSCSTAMNITTSVIISARLLLYRRTISQVVGLQQGQFYLDYMTMTLESAILYTVFAILTLVLFTIGSPLLNVVFPILGIVQVIAPSLIVYRIARGFSFELDSRGNSTVGTLRFTSEPRPLRGRARVHDSLDVSRTMPIPLQRTNTDLEESSSFMPEFEVEQTLDLVPSVNVPIDDLPEKPHHDGSFH